mmetsp:Transcript_72671/g.117878  ORF Transcript_72671/g.117878 Transcript_72671/m.117878 type:complete len:285 (-) Transcript_72671:32-886(-)
MRAVAILPAMLSLGFAAAFSTPPLLRVSHPAARAASGASVTCSIWSSGVGLYVSTKSSRARQASLRMSSMPSGDSDEVDGDNEKESMQNRAHLFYRSDNGTRNSEFVGIVRTGQTEDSTNSYVNMLESLTPGEMVGQFMATAPPRVQSAVKNTVVGLLGSLRASAAFDSSVVTTQRALASLMFQLEMTGYMFRNAEYRLALQKTLLESSSPELPPSASTRPQLKGSITVTLPDGTEVEVDANAYVSELSKEVEGLKYEIVALRQKREEDKLQVVCARVGMGVRV